MEHFEHGDDVPSFDEGSLIEDKINLRGISEHTRNYFDDLEDKAAHDVEEAIKFIESQSEFDILKKDEKQLAVNMFMLCAHQVANPDQYKETTIEVKDLVKGEYGFTEGIFEDKTKQYVAGQVIPAINRLVIQQENN